MGTRGVYQVKRCHDEEIVSAAQKPLVDSGDLPYVEFENREWWVVWSGEKPVGYAGMKIWEDYAWFSICGVIPVHRGHGLQKRLISVRVRHAKKVGVKVIYTYTINGNHPSSCSLIRRHFVLCTPPDRHYGQWAGKRDVLYWQRTLTKGG